MGSDGKKGRDASKTGARYKNRSNFEMENQRTLITALNREYSNPYNILSQIYSAEIILLKKYNKNKVRHGFTAPPYIITILSSNHTQGVCSDISKYRYAAENKRGCSLFQGPSLAVV